MILREPLTAERRQYDLIIVGGGIYGACLSLEAGKRGMKCLLLERDDFGQATSWNCLRIIHGGLRYLQRFDLERYRESVAERQWFLQHFPDLVEPVSCLMPLYGHGLRRPTVVKIALGLNDFLSMSRNRGVRKDRWIDRSRVLSKSETIELFPMVDRNGLQGAALWQDAVMSSPQRLLIEILRWAASYGATLLNYVEALELITHCGETRGVVAIDRETRTRLAFEAPIVVNCAGPWCAEIASRFRCEDKELFYPTLAFNVLLDAKTPSDLALAVAANRPDAQTLFLLPCKKRILAGTFHAPWRGSIGCPAVNRAQLNSFLHQLNLSVPGLNVTSSDVLRIYAGLLPGAESRPHGLAVREKVVDHSITGGPRGTYSISGVKYTTARRVAEKFLTRFVFGHRYSRSHEVLGLDRPTAVNSCDFDSVFSFQHSKHQPTASQLQTLINEEAVVHLDDLLLRRTDGTIGTEDLKEAADVVCNLLKWDDTRRTSELARICAASARMNLDVDENGVSTESTASCEIVEKSHDQA